MPLSILSVNICFAGLKELYVLQFHAVFVYGTSIYLIISQWWLLDPRNNTLVPNKLSIMILVNSAQAVELHILFAHGLNFQNCLTYFLALVIVYDVTRRETFTNLSDVWAKEVELYSTNQDCVKMLVGNKVDRVSLVFSFQSLKLKLIIEDKLTPLHTSRLKRLRID